MPLLRAAVLAAAGVTLLASAPAAMAANVADLSVGSAPGQLSFRISTESNDSDPPNPPRKLTLYLAAGFRVDAARFSPCQRRVLLQAPSRCPQTSRLGGGRATVLGVNSSISRRPIESRATVAVYRGPTKGGRPTLLFLLRSQARRAPAWAEVLEGVVLPEPASGDFGSRLAVSVPDFGVIGLYQALTELNVRLDGGGLVRRPGFCPDGGWRFSVVATYYDRTGRRAGPARSAQARARC